MKGKMSKAGYAQGDMAPHVEDYQKPKKDFSQEGFSKTTEYVSRQDAYQAKEARGVEKQAYKGRDAGNPREYLSRRARSTQVLGL